MDGNGSAKQWTQFSTKEQSWIYNDIHMYIYTHTHIYIYICIYIVYLWGSLTHHRSVTPQETWRTCPCCTASSRNRSARPGGTWSFFLLIGPCRCVGCRWGAKVETISSTGIDRLFFFSPSLSLFLSLSSSLSLSLAQGKMKVYVFPLMQIEDGTVVKSKESCWAKFQRHFP